MVLGFVLVFGFWFLSCFSFLMTDVPTLSSHQGRGVETLVDFSILLHVTWLSWSLSRPFLSSLRCGEFCHSLSLGTFVPFVFRCTSEAHHSFHLGPIHA